jgi:hypothetical protein
VQERVRATKDCVAQALLPVPRRPSRGCKHRQECRCHTSVVVTRKRNRTHAQEKREVMNALPEKVFTARNETLAPGQNEAEALTLIKNEAEACSSCQVCGEPGPVFDCPECNNSNLCCECYDMCQLAHWSDSDTRREQLAGIKGAR